MTDSAAELGGDSLGSVFYLVFRGGAGEGNRTLMASWKIGGMVVAMSCETIGPG